MVLEFLFSVVTQVGCFHETVSCLKPSSRAFFLVITAVILAVWTNEGETLIEDNDVAVTGDNAAAIAVCAVGAVRGGEGCGHPG